MTTTTERETPPAGKYRVVGTRPVRPDGTDKVTGRASYGADIRLPGMLYGRVKRSPHAHARILSIDASKALALTGVRAVITAADFPDPGDAVVPTIRGPIPKQWQLDHIIAGRKVLFRGHPVAAICATDPHIAEDALALIDVVYEVLPAVTSAREARLPGAPLIHDDGLAASVPGLLQLVDGRPTNTSRRTELRVGDIAAGFADADVVIEREFDTAMTHQGYIEPHNGTALWNQDGRLTVWTSTQGAFGVRQAVADLLDLPVATVRVVPMEIGGGFGGKLVTYLEPLAALLSRKTGRPVQITMSRTEVFEASGPTSATQSRVRIGAKRDGKIVAAEAHLVYESGAYPGAPVSGGARCAFGPYDIPNQYVEGFEVIVNKPKVAAYRAPGAPQSEFAVECVIDELADTLGLDPMELRMRNAAREGTRRPDGAVHGVIGNVEVMQALISSPHYQSELAPSPDPTKRRGRGVAMGFWQNGGGESSAYANVHPDGTVSLVLGSVDIGGQRAACAMQFAQTLGVAYEDVNPLVTDTDSIGYTGNTGGSRTTFATGWAVHEAAMDIRRQLEERASLIWEVDRAAVAFTEDGVVRGPDGRQMTFRELAAELPRTGGMVQGRIDIVPTSAGGVVGPAFAGHIADLEVDILTGKVEVLRYTAVQDVGTAVHPSYVEGQIQGGAAQGIGMALNEEYIYNDDGVMSNASFLDYRMPVANDLPMIDVVLVEVPNPGHPYGVRGVGEVPIVPPLAAVANALTAALGTRITHLPASPTVILDEIGALDD